MKRAIFVRSKTIVMTELDKKIREKEIYRVIYITILIVILINLYQTRDLIHAK